MFDTPSLPMESYHISHPTGATISNGNLFGGAPSKTVSRNETVLQKNRVVSYSINSIYMLLLYNAIEKGNGWREEIKVSIGGCVLRGIENQKVKV